MKRSNGESRNTRTFARRCDRARQSAKFGGRPYAARNIFTYSGSVLDACTAACLGDSHLDRIDRPGASPAPPVSPRDRPKTASEEHAFIVVGEFRCPSLTGDALGGAAPIGESAAHVMAGCARDRAVSREARIEIELSPERHARGAQGIVGGEQREPTRRGEPRGRGAQGSLVEPCEYHGQLARVAHRAVRSCVQLRARRLHARGNDGRVLLGSSGGERDPRREERYRRSVALRRRSRGSPTRSRRLPRQTSSRERITFDRGVSYRGPFPCDLGSVIEKEHSGGWGDKRGSSRSICASGRATPENRREAARRSALRSL